MGEDRGRCSNRRRPHRHRDAVFYDLAQTLIITFAVAIMSSRQSMPSRYYAIREVLEMRIIASATFAALLLAAALPALADEFEWGRLSTKPRDNQNTIWDAHCNDSSEHVVSGKCTITEGSGTLQNVGVNDDRDTWTCVWGETVKATARALCGK
jgi:hypothetical protein